MDHLPFIVRAGHEPDEKRGTVPTSMDGCKRRQSKKLEGTEHK